MRTARTTSTNCTIRFEDMLKRDMFTINRGQVVSSGVRYSENLHGYVWGKPMMRMLLEVQCLAVSIIVTTQVWILSYYGSRIFERLVGDDIALPLLYLAAIVFGTLTYVRPSYWRIVMSLTLYCLVVYFSLMVTNLAVQILITPGLAEVLQESPENTRVWIPWAIGFALHLQIGISSLIITVISIRDMYQFSPVFLTGAATDGLLKHSIIVEPIAVLNNNRSMRESTAVIVQLS